jgi:hypothetical protein
MCRKEAPVAGFMGFSFLHQNSQDLEMVSNAICGVNFVLW